MLTRREFIKVSSLTSAAVVIGWGTLVKESGARIENELMKDRFGTTNPLWDFGLGQWGCSQYHPILRVASSA
jgi:hypothetical protein